MIRPLLLGSILAIATAASAQMAWVEVDDQVLVAPFQLTADQVDDLDVVDASGRKIGEVEDVVGPSRTEATAVVVDLDDDSGLIQGDADIAVPLTDVQLTGKALRLTGDAVTIGGYAVYED